ncbi:MAG TPA: thiamine pyrophosphate-dependent enzyme, partial [Edaphobacter sp.]|nr:thiamine pyrophosphate-dependent enzyme [Edaphobacter sp.]
MTGMSAGEAGENPLVPNEKLRQMYLKMLEARKLDETAAKRATAAGKRRVATIRGQEAVRVSTVIELGQHDLISDTAPTAGMGYLLGGDRATLVRGMVNGKVKREDVLKDAGCTGLLRWIAEDDERVHLSLGAALALKAQGWSGVVVAYSEKDALSAAEWKKILTRAAKLELPIIFVVLPRSGAVRKGAELNELCGAARAAGVPGIPVDACDSVALYRVTQESLGRTRGGDGPVLIESVRWRVEGKRNGIDDPLEHMKQFLLERRICDSKWFVQ